MNSVEKCAKSVEEAIDEALVELGVKREDVDVEIIEKGEKKGFLGLKKGKDAKVKVTLRENKTENAVPDEFKCGTFGEQAEEKQNCENNGDVEELNEDALNGIKDFLNKIIESLEVDAKFDIASEHKIVRITLKGDDIGRLVGAGGHTLESIQLLLNAMSYNKLNVSKKIIIDTEEYRKKREDYLKRVAKSSAEKAVKYNRKVTLSPMNSFERRIVHSELQDDDRIKTYSVGEEPNRRIVVELR